MEEEQEAQSGEREDEGDKVEMWSKVRAHYVPKQQKQRDAESGVTLASVALPPLTTSLAPLPLPHGKPSTHIIRMLEHGNFSHSFSQLMMSNATGNLLSCIFWYILALEFKTLKDVPAISEYKTTLFDHMCCWYALVFQSLKTTGVKDTLLRGYAESLSQALFFAFQHSFPYDLGCFDTTFHLSVQTNVAYWVGGVVLSKPFVRDVSKQHGDNTPSMGTSGNCTKKAKTRLTKRQIIQKNWCAAMGSDIGVEGAPPPCSPTEKRKPSESADASKTTADIAHDLYFIKGSGQGYVLHYGRAGAPVSQRKQSSTTTWEETDTPDTSDDRKDKKTDDDTDMWQAWMGRHARGVFCLDAASPLLRHFLNHVVRQGTAYIAEPIGNGRDSQVSNAMKQAEGTVPAPSPIDSVYHSSLRIQFVSSSALGDGDRLKVRKNVLKQGKLLHTVNSREHVELGDIFKKGTWDAVSSSAPRLVAALRPGPAEEDAVKTPLSEALRWQREFEEIISSETRHEHEDKALQQVSDTFASTFEKHAFPSKTGRALRPASAPLHRAGQSAPKTRPHSATSTSFTGCHPVAINEDCDPTRSWVPITQQYSHMSNAAKVQMHATNRKATDQVKRDAMSPVPVLNEPPQRQLQTKDCPTRSLLNHKAQSNRVPRAKAVIGWQSAKQVYSRKGVEVGRMTTEKSSRMVKETRQTWERADALTNNQQEEMQKSMILLTAENERVLAKLKNDQDTTSGEAMRLITTAVDRVNTSAKANVLDSIVAVSDLRSLINANLCAVSEDVRDVLVQYSTRAASQLHMKCKEARLQYSSSPYMLEFLQKVENSLKASAGSSLKVKGKPARGGLLAEEDVRDRDVECTTVSPRVGQDVPSLMKEAQEAEEAFLAQGLASHGLSDSTTLDRLRTDGKHLGQIGLGYRNPCDLRAPGLASVVDLVCAEEKTEVEELKVCARQNELTPAKLAQVLEETGERLKEQWATAEVPKVKVKAKATVVPERKQWNSRAVITATDRFLRSPLLKQWRKSDDVSTVVMEDPENKTKREMFDKLAVTLDRRSHAPNNKGRTKMEFEGFSAIDGYVVWSDTAEPVGSSSEELIQVCTMSTIALMSFTTEGPAEQEVAKGKKQCVFVLNTSLYIAVFQYYLHRTEKKKLAFFFFFFFFLAQFDQRIS